MTKSEFLYFIEKRLKSQYNLECEIWTDGEHILVNNHKMKYCSISKIFQSIDDLTCCWGISREEEVVSNICFEIAHLMGMT